MVTTASIIIPLLAFWLWWPLNRLSHLARWCAIAVTTALGLFPAVLLKMAQTGAMEYTQVARLQVPAGWVLAVLLILALLILLRDVLWAFARLLKRKVWSDRLHQPALTIVAMVLTGVLCAWGVNNGLQPPQVREQTLSFKNLPPELDGLRLAVLADIHASPVNDAAYVQTIVDRTLAATPDLIMLPGDMVDGDVASGRANVAPLTQLKAPYGVWAAPGNHEYYSGYDSWMGEFRRMGLNLLENRMQLLEIKGTKLALSGIGDPVYGRTSHNNTNPEVPEGIPPDVDHVAQQAEAAGAQFHILLAHQPKFARDNAERGIHLQVSGHTHGGQIIGMDRWVTAPVNNGFVRGAYDVGDMLLWVSSGAGLWAGFTARLGVPSSIDLLTLRRAAP